jgi:PAS domain S-box-containing protein
MAVSSRDEFEKRMADLRRRAEVHLADAMLDEAPGNRDAARRLLHDLHVHQIELQLQNEELREAQRDLARSRDRYLELYHSAPVGYVVMDEAGMIAQANRTFGQMVDRELAALVNQPLARLIHAEDRSVFFSRYRAFYKHPGEKCLEIRLIAGEGRFFHAALQGRRIAPPDRLLVSVSDVTDQKRAEEAMLRMRNLESIGTLAGGIAHDFNNILTALVGHIEMAKLRAQGGEPIHGFLDGALEAAFRAKALAGRLLTFAKAGSLRQAPVMIDRLLQETIPRELSGTHITVDMQISQGLGPLIIDEAQVRSAIRNVIDNAREAMPWGGPLAVTARNVEIRPGSSAPMPPGKYVQIDIRDRGRGISPAHLDKIFDPYFTTKPMGTQRGVGLGLAISHSIIQRHHGHIAVHAVEGEGTTVTIHLPWPPRPAEPKGAAPPTADPAQR